MPVVSHDVSQLNPVSLRKIGNSLVHLHGDVLSMEEMADEIVDFIYKLFRETPDAPSQCAMVRLFKTCAVDELTPELKTALPGNLDPDARCLALLGTRGDHESWNSRHDSRGHKVISLESAEIVEQFPMISNLIRMLGLNLHDIVKPNPDLNVAGFYPLSVFYVDEALDSPYIPSKQDFVAPYGIHSVVGFGGLMSYSDMFTIIIFFKIPVSREVAALFKNLAEEVHGLLMPFQVSGNIFKDK